MHPMSHEAALAGFYDYRLVALSVIIAILSAYAALDLGGRVTASRGNLRRFWLTGGAMAMGSGIWAMHYIGMLAYSLPVAVHYDAPTVFLSLLAAVLASAVALFVVSRNELTPLTTGCGGVLMGLGIAAMHYIGMEAMRLPAMCHYAAGVVGLSIVLAIVISLVALWLTFHLRSETNSIGWKKLCSALLMGAAIPVMHYTGMAAVTYTPTTTTLDLSNSVEISALGIAGIGGVTLLILGLTILTSLVDRRFSAQSFELERSEQRYRQIVESAKVILWRGDIALDGFNFVNQEAIALLGYAQEEWLRTPMFWLDHIHPDDRDLAESAREAAAKGRGSQRFEHRMTSINGAVVWLRTSIRLVEREKSGGELVGVMTDITERKRAQEVAEEASAAKSALLAEIERLNVQLKQDNSRMSGELDITRRLQQMMLPQDEDLSKFANLDIAGYMDPASEIGGDYYDVVRKENGAVFCIGDVTGHGLESGVIAIMVQTAVRTLLASGFYENQRFFEILNRVIFENTRRMHCDRNLTFSLLQYQNKHVVISGQHEEVLIVRRNGNLERHDTLNLGFPLGLEENISSFIAETTVPLDAGDVMVVYTDGITEAIDCAGVCYGLERLCQAILASSDKSAQAIRQAVLENLTSYIGDQRLLDDVSLLVIKPA